ncbi:MAG: acyl-CoA thioesterase [Nannocystaceae bacterium]
MSGVFIHRRTVRFGDCDPAGIVYYPRFFDIFHESMEQWFWVALDYRYDRVILDDKVGFPTVHCAADFKIPAIMGEDLAIEVRVPKIGRSSIHFDYQVRTFGDPSAPLRLRGETVSVVMDLDPARPTFRRPLEIPADLRARIEAFRGGPRVGA